MRRQLKAFRIVCSPHGNVGFPPKPRRVVASGFSDSFDHPSSTWEEMATSGKPVSILGHVGPSTIMKTKPFPPNIYCCTCVCSLEGNFWLRCGQEAMWPQGHRAHTGCHNEQVLVQTTHGPEDSSATLQGGPGGNGGGGDNNISGDTNNQHVTKYKRQQLRVCAFPSPSARPEFKFCCVTRQGVRSLNARSQRP